MGLRRWVVNFSILRLSLGCVLCSVLGGPSLHAAGYGFDVGQSPADYAHDLAEAGLTGEQGTWMRVRGLVDPAQAKAGDLRTVDTDRAGLQALRDRGIRTAVHLRWPSSDWKTGVRAGGGQRYPLDLREAYERCHRFAAAYGDLVNVWEIENEPDIDFVVENPETHAAFQKAVYLGLKAAVPPSGSKVEGRKAQVLGARWKVSGWRYHKTGFLGLTLDLGPSTFDSPPASRVVMAPLALPPGPYFERLWANGLASYTDGFNFHYYGYADDFTGVYRQFESAVNELSADSMVAGRRSNVVTCARSAPHSTLDFKTWDLRPRWTVVGLDLVSSRSAGAASREVRPYKKPLPVFITEYGYGLLDAEARDTVEGRVRQWRWFASLAKQIRTLRPEGPMAFLLNPYYEANLNEFGLLATSSKFLATTDPCVGPDLASGRADGAASRKVRPYVEPASGTRATSGQKRATSSQQLVTSSYTPDAFGERRVQPWMRRIGQSVGAAYASPALAYLWDYAERHPYQARAWTVQAAPPSPVVIDFVADRDLVQVKRSGGYAVRGVSVEWSPLSERFGRGRWVLYNFGAAPVSGELVITDPSVVVTLPATAMTLAPGERREVPIEVRVPGDVWTPRTLGVRFVPTAPAVGTAVFSTRLYPDAADLEITPVAGFAFAPEATRARQAALLAREHAQVVHQTEDAFHTYSLMDWIDFSDYNPPVDAMETVHTINRSIRLPRVILLTFFDKLPCKELKLTRNNDF